MIKVIYGSKGTGKTKMLIDAANAAVATAKGHLIFITDTKRYMYELERDVRFIDVSDYDVAGEAALCGFVKGVIAGNHDNEYVFKWLFKWNKRLGNTLFTCIYYALLGYKFIWPWN